MRPDIASVARRCSGAFPGMHDYQVVDAAVAIVLVHAEINADAVGGGGVSDRAPHHALCVPRERSLAVLTVGVVGRVLRYGAASRLPEGAVGGRDTPARHTRPLCSTRVGLPVPSSPVNRRLSEARGARDLMRAVERNWTRVSPSDLGVPSFAVGALRSVTRGMPSASGAMTSVSTAALSMPFCARVLWPAVTRASRGPRQLLHARLQARAPVA